MTEVSAELAQWVRDNHCSYDITPIIELQHGDQTEVGFELNLHAELPWRGESTPELREKAEEIKTKLAELVDALVPKESEAARIEIVPFRGRAVRFAHGAGLPLMSRTVRIFRKDFSHVEPEDRAKFHPFEAELHSIGFKKA
jgi:hypothetical protein